MPFESGQQIGNYTLIKKIGEGGFGEVWLAENRNNPSSEKVAIKLPLKEQLDLQTVKEEIFNWTIAGKHKNILPFIECEVFGNQVAIVSEFAPDGSLQNLIEKHRVFSVADAVEIIIGILDGLAHLHNRKIIHRDLKPDNVLFQGRTPRLTDFGISRALPVGSKSATISGTLHYMAPEAFDGKRTEKTDIWSVGVILYQMSSGNLPFPQREQTELFGAIVMREPDKLPDSVPSDLQNIVKKSLGKDSAKRYQTADEMKADLKEALKTWESSETEQIIDEPILILPTEDWQDISQSQLETEEYREEKEIPNQTTQLSISEENNETLPLGNSEQVEETKPYVNFFSSQVEANQTAKPEFDIPKPVSTKRKSNKLYFAVPAILLLLFSFIGGGLWLNSKTNNDKQITASNTSTKDSPTPIPTPTPLLDEDGEILLIPYRKGDKFGFSDSNKKLVIEAKYDSAKPFSEGLAKVEINEKYGFINRNGMEVVPINYVSVGEISEDLVEVKQDNKLGFVDKNGNVVIPLKYQSVWRFSEGLSSVRLTNLKAGFIDKSGEIKIPLKFDRADPFQEGLSRVVLNGKYGYIDKLGNLAIPMKFDDTNYFYYKPEESFSEGLACIKIKDKYGFIDILGNITISPKYYFARPFSEGLAKVSLDNKYGFINKTGKEIIPLKFENVESFSEGLAEVSSLDKKWGFIDKTGNQIIPFKYDRVNSFHEGLAKVFINHRYGFIDKIGNLVIPIKYGDRWDYGDFDNKLAQVNLNGKKFYIDKNGTEYYEP